MNAEEIEALRDMYEAWGYGTVRGYLDAWADEAEGVLGKETPA